MSALDHILPEDSAFRLFQDVEVMHHGTVGEIYSALTERTLVADLKLLEATGDWHAAVTYDIWRLRLATPLSQLALGSSLTVPDAVRERMYIGALMMMLPTDVTTLEFIHATYRNWFEGKITDRLHGKVMGAHFAMLTYQPFYAPYQRVIQTATREPVEHTTYPDTLE